MPETGSDLRAEGWAAITLPDLSDALAAGEVTSRELTEAYLARIDLVDPHLQAVLAVNPDALAQADASDARRAAGEALGPLDGLPILLKDNIETADPIATTAGALALEGNVTGRDAPLMAGLREAGVVMLGKTNLSQWANYRSDRSISGWSALGGQVRNPHVLDRSPCGSSAGSGAAAAASLAAGTVGTETSGSIICPSNVNGIVGFKPTVGLVSQQYIIPISHSQDTAGPMTKTVRGAAMLLTAMADGEGATDFAAALDDGALAGARIGVLRFSQGSNPDIVARFDEALAVLEAEGAELVDITEFNPQVEDFWMKVLAILDTEFKVGLNAYLADSPADLPVRSLEELIAFNIEHGDIELALFDQSIFDRAQQSTGLEAEVYQAAVADLQKAAGEDGITGLMAEYNVDVLVSPSGPVASLVDPVNGDVWPEWVGAGYMAAIAGYPHITVPMGDVHGVPIGLSFMAGAMQDAEVLSFAYDYEQASGMRIEPQYLATSEERPEIQAAMARRD